MAMSDGPASAEWPPWPGVPLHPLMQQPKPFSLHVPDEVLDDLQQRLARARFPDLPPHGEPWQYGADVTYVQQLVDYWRTASTGARRKRALNAFPQYTAPVAGIDVHFVHVPGVGPEPMPLLLSHGWPGSVLEFHKLIPLLTDPAQLRRRPGRRLHRRRALAARLHAVVQAGPAALRRRRRSPTSSPS